MPLLRILPLLALSLTLASCSSSQEGSIYSYAVPFTQYSGYYVSNKFEPAAPESFAAFTSQQSFDAAFGPAVVMNDTSHRLPPDIFQKHIVVAVIKRGNAVVQYHVQGVIAHHDTLTINYSTTSTPNPSAEFASPLILSLPISKHTTLQFNENGTHVKTLRIP